MNYYLLEPEVAGGLGQNSQIDRSAGKVDVMKLHYEFEGWLGDDLLESCPCFIGTVRLVELLNANMLSGYTIDNLEVSMSYEFRHAYPHRKLPEFLWIKVHGDPGIDDFGLSSNGSLVVSSKALSVLNQCNLNHCDIETFI